MRTLAEIYNQLATEKAAMSELDSFYTDRANPGSKLDDSQTFLKDLSSSSKVAIWRLLLWVVATGIWIHEGLWYQFKNEIDTALLKQVAHTARWYAEESLKFQYGDALVWSDELRSYVYAIYDENKKVVKWAACQEGSGIVTLKVAGENGALTAPQKVSFAAFWGKYKDAGVVLNIISEAADLLKLTYTIYYDPLVLNASGALISDGTTRPIDLAIENYIASIDFNGRFRLEGCDAAIRAAAGVIDFKRNGAQSKQGSNPYENIEVSRVAYSGYYKIDPAFLLEDTISYEPNV